MLLKTEREIIDPQLISHPTDGPEGAQGAPCIRPRSKDKIEALVLHVQQRHGRRRIPPNMAEFERIKQIRLTEVDLLRRAARDLVAYAARAASAREAPNVETLVVEGDPRA